MKGKLDRGGLIVGMPSPQHCVLSILRRFEQCLREGETRFKEDIQCVTEIICSYFNVESIVERIRTCKPEERKGLWIDLKLIGKGEELLLLLMVGHFCSNCL